jgi:GNAT superfamily N-acetyltransferase
MIGFILATLLTAFAVDPRRPRQWEDDGLRWTWQPRKRLLTFSWPGHPPDEAGLEMYVETMAQMYQRYAREFASWGWDRRRLPEPDDELVAVLGFIEIPYEERGQGIGSHALDIAHGFAASMGARAMYVLSTAHAVGFYEANGFEMADAGARGFRNMVLMRRRVVAEAPRDLTGLTTEGKRRLLYAAAEELHRHDAEVVEGGCGDVVTVLEAFARDVGMTGVEVRSGQARSKKGRPMLPHAWLVIDGERFDPTWEIVLGQPGIRYDEDPAVLDMLVCDPEWYVESYVPVIREALVERGVALPEKPERLGTEDPPRGARFPDVDPGLRDLQDTVRVVDAESVRRDYGGSRGDLDVYFAYVPFEDVPTPQFAEIETNRLERRLCRERAQAEYEAAVADAVYEKDRERAERDLEEDLEQCEREWSDDGGYDWSEIDSGGTYPPAKLFVTRDGEVRILDGNHRLSRWDEAGYTHAPCWVLQERP